jgi:hypothetical protein
MAKITRIECEKRRERIKDLAFSKLLNANEIREVLIKEGFHPPGARQIKRDMKILREEFVKELGKNPLADILSEGREQCNRIIRSAWLNYARADNDKAKNFYLNTILQAEKEKAELYKKVGLLKAEVQQVEDVAARIIKAVVEAEKD